MAKHKIVYIDDHGLTYDREQDADRANLRYKADEVCTTCRVFDRCDLSGLDGVNHQTLAPLQAYIDLLVRESMERTEKFGGGRLVLPGDGQ